MSPNFEFSSVCRQGIFLLVLPYLNNLFAAARDSVSASLLVCSCCCGHHASSLLVRSCTVTRDEFLQSDKDAVKLVLSLFLIIY